MFFLWFITFLGNPEVALVKKIVLEVESPRTPPAIVVDGKGQIFYRDYSGQQVSQLDPDGRAVRPIGRSGEGPGEYFRPRFLLLLEQEAKLVVVEGMGRITWFSTATGRYGGVIHKSLAAVDAVVSWDQSSFLVFGGPSINLDAVLNILDIQGNVLTSWFKEDTFDLSPVRTETVMAVNTKNAIVFVTAQGPTRTLRVTRPEQAQASLWELLPPKHYREPPTKPLNPNHRFDRDKLLAFYREFPLIKFMKVIDFQYLAVGWHAPWLERTIVDIYHIDSRARMGQSLELDGLLLEYANGHFYSYVEKDLETDQDSDPITELLLYRLTLQ